MHAVCEGPLGTSHAKTRSREREGKSQPDAWIKEEATRIGYKVSFTRHFYKPQPLRTLEEIHADILAIEKEAEGLLTEITKGVGK